MAGSRIGIHLHQDEERRSRVRRDRRRARQAIADAGQALREDRERKVLGERLMEARRGRHAQRQAALLSAAGAAGMCARVFRSGASRSPRPAQISQERTQMSVG